MTVSNSSNPPLPNQARRRLLGGSILTLAGLSLACSRSGEAAGTAAAAANAPAPLVTIVEFSADGTRGKTATLPKVIKSMDEWRAQLSPLSFWVTRRQGTERAFSGKYDNWHDKGIFRCICCDTALFSSNAKFDSGTGWPSFWQPIAEENMVADKSHIAGMYGAETSCRRCSAHLGHIFSDGPKPTGLRYCINSVALRFDAAA